MLFRDEQRRAVWDRSRPPLASGDQLELLDEDTAESASARRKRWAWLPAHLFRADVDTCPHCGGPHRLGRHLAAGPTERRFFRDGKAIEW